MWVVVVSKITTVSALYFTVNSFESVIQVRDSGSVHLSSMQDFCIDFIRENKEMEL